MRGRNFRTPKAERRAKAREGGAKPPLTESATENIPPARVRVKRRGKSPPRKRQLLRQCKPRSEQGQKCQCTACTLRQSGPPRQMASDGVSRNRIRGMTQLFLILRFFWLCAQAHAWQISYYAQMPSFAFFGSRANCTPYTG